MVSLAVKFCRCMLVVPLIEIFFGLLFLNLFFSVILFMCTSKFRFSLIRCLNRRLVHLPPKLFQCSLTGEWSKNRSKYEYTSTHFSGIPFVTPKSEIWHFFLWVGQYVNSAVETFSRWLFCMVLYSSLPLWGYRSWTTVGGVWRCNLLWTELVQSSRVESSQL